MKIENIQNLDSFIEIPIPESYRDCWTLVKSDYSRWRKKNSNIFKIVLYTLFNYNFALCFWLRLSKYKGWLFPFFRWRLEHTCRKHGISFSRNVKLGYGLKIVHAIGIIINVTAVIGNNCTIHQFLTIGSDKNKAAVIGDNVYIGPTVCIVENVHIGNNVVIGAGAVVTKDIINNTIVAGVPAKPIKIYQQQNT